MAFYTFPLLIYSAIVVAKEYTEHLTKCYTGVGSPNAGISRSIAAGRYSNIKGSVPHIKYVCYTQPMKLLLVANLLVDYVSPWSCGVAY
jgi:hypothetical protein